jgi:hypothetical protein
LWREQKKSREATDLQDFEGLPEPLESGAETRFCITALMVRPRPGQAALGKLSGTLEKL